MANDTSATVIIDVQLGTADAKAKAIEITNQMVALKAAQDTLKASGQQLSVQYTENAQKLAALGQEQKAYLTIANSTTSSDNAKAAQLKLLTNQYKTLSDEEKTNTVQGQALTAQTAKLKDELNNSGAAIKNFTGNVGNYPKVANGASEATRLLNEELKGSIATFVPFGNELIKLTQFMNSMTGSFTTNTKAEATQTEATVASSAAMKGEAAAAVEATEAVEGMGLAATLATGGVLLIATAIAGLIAFVSQLAPVTNKLEQVWEGMKASFIAAGESIRNGDWANLSENMSKADEEARGLTEDLQKLTAEINAQSVSTARAEEQISVLMLKLRNRRNTPEQEADYFNQIQALGLKNYQNQKYLADQSFDNAVAAAANGKNLDDWSLNQLKGHNAAMNAALMEENGEINKGTAKRIADAQKMQIAAEQYKETVDQKAQNRKDAQDLRQEAAAKALAEKLAEIEKDRQKSLVATAESIMTIRQKELEDINADIAKRKVMYDKFGKDSTNLETERLARIAALHKKFAIEDMAEIQKNLRDVMMAQVKAGNTSFGSGTTDQQAKRLQNLFDIEDVNKQIKDVQERVDKGEKGLTEVLQSYQNKRIDIVRRGNEQETQFDWDNLKTKQEISDQRKKLALDEFNLEQTQAQQEEDLAQKKATLNEQILQSYGNMFGVIADLFQKNSLIHKAAFVFEQSLAIAKIVIQANAARAKILIETEQATAAAGLSGIGAVLIPGFIALGALETAAVTATEIEGIANIVGATIKEFSGHAKGGMITGPGTGKSDSIPARLSNGESVINAKSTQMFRPLLSEMNVAGGGKPFAGGGIAGTYIPTLSNQVNADNAISRSVISGLKGAKIVTFIEDINYGQQRMKTNIEAGNF